MRAQLVDLYENDCIFDKFDACFSASGAHMATGSYANCFRVVSKGDGANTALEASRDPQRKRIPAAPAKVGCPPPRLIQHLPTHSPQGSHLNDGSQSLLSALAAG
jgi:serine/threonine-protein phosphatase 2A regulatory subunit B